TKIPTNGTSSLKIGARGNDALTPFNGLISSVSIYNRALSAEEIAYLYAFPWCIYEAGQGAWAQKDYGREARLANYYQQMRAA
ncbi:MAG: LamG-like jellyroll fold domain-containing protein, partial [bacterium]